MADGDNFDVVKKIVKFAPYVRNTIKWANGVRAPVDLQNKPEKTVGVWAASAASVTIVVFSVIMLFWFYHYNLLDMHRPLGDVGPYDLFGRLISTGNDAAQQISNRSIGSSSFVVLASILLTGALTALAAFILVIRKSEVWSRLARVETFAYQMLPAAVKFFFCSCIFVIPVCS